MKKALALCLAAALLGPLSYTPSALAAEHFEIKSASPSDRETLDLYAAPKDPQPVRHILVADVVFPLIVLETRSGFSSVAIGDKTYWVRNLHVRRTRKIDAQCPPLRMRDTGPVVAAQTPGVNTTACGK